MDTANDLPMCQLHDPGPGVGGHCIPYYPHFLLGRTDEPMAVTETARRVNHEMPSVVVDRLERELARVDTDTAEASVVVLGVTYRPGVEETRASPALGSSTTCSSGEPTSRASIRSSIRPTTARAGDDRGAVGRSVRRRRDRHPTRRSIESTGVARADGRHRRARCGRPLGDAPSRARPRRLERRTTAAGGRVIPMAVSNAMTLIAMGAIETESSASRREAVSASTDGGNDV